MIGSVTRSITTRLWIIKMSKISDIKDPGERQRAMSELLRVDPTDDSRVTVLYYGHSFVHHLRDYVRHQEGWRNWGFSPRQAEIHYYSQSGATIEKMLLPEHLWHIEFMRPDIVVIEIATNDLARNGTKYTPERLAEQARELVLAIRDRGVKQIILNQVLPRGETGMDRTIKQSRGRAVPVTRAERIEACKNFKEKAVNYNELCHTDINSIPSCRFWHHHNLWKHIDQEVKDGTHLNDVAQSKLIKSVKGAVIVSMKLIRPAWYDNSGRLLHCYRRMFAREGAHVPKESK